MSNLLRVVLVDPDDSERQKLKNLLLGMESIWLESDCSRYEFFPDVVAQAEPDIGIVALDSDPERGIALVEWLSVQCPRCMLLVVSGSSDGHLILRTIRAGAREFLPLPLARGDLQAALARVRVQKFGANESPQEACEVIAVAGANGGIGCTSIASNIACLLAAEPERSVALVDLDLALGDADVLLNLIPEYTLADVAGNASQLDLQLLKQSLTRHESGLYLLPRPAELSDAATVDEETVGRIIGLLRSSFSHLVIDLSKSYTPVDFAAMQLATHVMLVVELDLACLRNVARLLINLEEVEGLGEKVEIVVNHVRQDSPQIGLKKAKETLGREIFAMLPNDSRTMAAVRNQGVPLVTQAPKSPLSVALRDLLGRLAQQGQGDAGAGAESAQSRWRRFWPGAKLIRGA